MLLGLLLDLDAFSHSTFLEYLQYSMNILHTQNVITIFH